MKPRALYLHVPFCKAKCLYCDFDSRALSGCALDASMNRYCDSLIAQLDACGVDGALDEVDTVYIGGGTPSLLGKRLLSLIERVCLYARPREFTCEANPESFTLDLAQALREAGVTRISLGVQSLDPDELKAIGRIHSAEQAMLAIAQAKAVGFSTSCDVMCGLPGQTLRSFDATLRALITLNPDHVSVYPLQLEEGTPLAVLEEKGSVEVPDEDFQAACMDAAADLLSEAGYDRYEVASYAKPGHRCRHNIAYWTGLDYLALGRSASGMCNMGPGAYLPACARVAGLDAIDLPHPGGLVSSWRDLRRESDGGRVRYRQLDDEGTRFETEVLGLREAMAEDLMLACRMTDGISPCLLERAAAVIPRCDLDATCSRAVELGLAAWEDGSLKPTHCGWLEGNELFGLFWSLAE